MAKLKFDNAKIKAIVTTVGDKRVAIEEEASNYGYDERTLKRLKRSMGFESRYIVSDKSICTSDLCIESAKDIFNSLSIDPKSIDALIFVSQTPDYKAPSTAIIMQDRLGLSTDTIAYDINLGCSGYINGLLNAFMLINSGLKRVLLCVGDISSQFAYKEDKNLTPLMGDAGSAILIDSSSNPVDSYFVLHSDGSGYKHLIIPSGGCRQPFTTEALEIKSYEDGSKRRDIDMYMNGAEIFNFTIKVVPKMFEEILEFASLQKDDIDYYLLHQANRYILQNIAKRLGIDEDRLPMGTVTQYGNQNSASIPGTINAFLSKRVSSDRYRVIFAGFGIGLSWGACITELDNIYAPKIKTYQPKQGDRE